MGNGCCCCGGKQDVSTSTGPLKPKYQSTNTTYQGNSRFNDVAISTKDPSKLIEGYDKGPLCDLDEALEPFHNDIDQLSLHIQEAKNKCNKSGKHKLTVDESAAIYIYTMDWERTCVYDQLQAAFRRGDKAEMTKWFKYIKLLKSGLDKLPDAKGDVWQGTEYDERTKELLTSDEQPLFVGFGSCSPSDKDLKQQMGGNAAGRKILIGYGKVVKAKDATGYTANGHPEFILFPGMKLGNADVNSSSDGSVYIHFTKRYMHYPKTLSPKSTSTEKHFACPYPGCRNRCPTGHEGSHCYTFAILSHSCEHHCYPGCYTCYKCKKLTHKLCKCYKCGTGSCENCCFK